MRSIGYLGYHISLLLYNMAVRLASMVNPKAKLFVEGRKGLIERIEREMRDEIRPRIWFHCASLGEFEQARPIIEQFKKKHSGFAIVITFFSPSGYEIRKNYRLADYVYYLPNDSKSNAERFVSSVKPTISFFVKYELWYHYLTQLHAAKFPVFLISANFRADHIYFKQYGVFFKEMLNGFTHIFCQNDVSCKRLLDVGITQVSNSRDTRFDTVFANVQAAKSIPEIERFVEDKHILVAGSCYAAEEAVVAGAMTGKPDWKMIMIPHQVNPERIDAIEKQFAGYDTIRFSAIVADTVLHSKQVLIIDNIGMLSSIYQYATCALIGGGFGKTGLHNTLEAVAFGMPILFGPNNHEKFPESLDMIEAGVGFVVKEEGDLKSYIDDWMTHPEKLSGISHAALHFVESQVGATQHIFGYLNHHIGS